MRAKSRTGLLLVALIACLSLVATGGHARTWPFKKTAGEKIGWTYDLTKGLALAQKEHKLVMVDFMAVWCPPCHAMEDSTFSSPRVIQKASAFIPVRIDIDKQREVAKRYNGLARKYGGIGIPNILFMTGDEKQLRHIVGYYAADSLIAVMDSVLAMRK